MTRIEQADGWIEDYDFETDTRAGTLILGGYALAGYQKQPNKHIVASVYLPDEMNEKSVLFTVEGRAGPFRDVDSAKDALQMIVRPNVHSRD